MAKKDEGEGKLNEGEERGDGGDAGFGRAEVFDGEEVEQDESRDTAGKLDEEEGKRRVMKVKESNQETGEDGNADAVGFRRLV